MSLLPGTSLAATNTKPGPRAEEKAKTDEEEQPKTPAAKKTPPPKKKPEPKKPKEDKDQPPVDMTVEFVDAAGHVARLPLSRYGIARHPLMANVYRRSGRDAQRFTNNFELIPQTFLIPLADFAQSASGFDPRQLATVRLVFDKTAAGTIIIEHVGMETPVPSGRGSGPSGPHRH